MTLELHDPSYAKRFYSIYEIFEESMTKVVDEEESLSGASFLEL